jgi:hypothetical protein
MSANHEQAQQPDDVMMVDHHDESVSSAAPSNRVSHLPPGAFLPRIVSFLLQERKTLWSRNLCIPNHLLPASPLLMALVAPVGTTRASRNCQFPAGSGCSELPHLRPTGQTRARRLEGMLPLRLSNTIRLLGSTLAIFSFLVRDWT